MPRGNDASTDDAEQRKLDLAAAALKMTGNAVATLPSATHEAGKPQTIVYGRYLPTPNSSAQKSRSPTRTGNLHEFTDETIYDDLRMRTTDLQQTKPTPSPMQGQCASSSPAERARAAAEAKDRAARAFERMDKRGAGELSKEEVCARAGRVWVGRGLSAERGTHFCEGCVRPGWRGSGGGWGLRSRARASDGSGRVLLAWGRGGDRRSRGRVLWHVAARL